MIKLVAFDWNGTIFADTYAIFESNNSVFKILNVKPVRLSIFQRYYDVPIKKFYLAVGAKEEDIDNKAKQIIQTFHADYEEKASKVRTRAHAKELLEFLSKNNINSVIFSNHIVESITGHLQRLKIQKYFQEVLGNSLDNLPLKGRNKDEKLRSYIESRNIKAKEVLIIGDTIEEVEIGKEVGCYTVALTHGNCSVARLKKANPDFLISNLKEVINIIKKLKYYK